MNGIVLGSHGQALVQDFWEGNWGEVPLIGQHSIYLKEGHEIARCGFHANICDLNGHKENYLSGAPYTQKATLICIWIYTPLAQSICSVNTCSINGWVDKWSAILQNKLGTPGFFPDSGVGIKGHFPKTKYIKLTPVLESSELFPESA